MHNTVNLHKKIQAAYPVNSVWFHRHLCRAFLVVTCWYCVQTDSVNSDSNPKLNLRCCKRVINEYHLTDIIVSWEALTIWRPLLPHGYSYRTSCARPGYAIRALSRSRLSVRVPKCQKLQIWLNKFWHRTLYSCTHMATVGVKGLISQLTVLGSLYDDDVWPWTVTRGCVCQHPDIVQRPLSKTSHSVRSLVSWYTGHITITAASASLAVKHAVAGQHAVPLVGRRRRPGHLNAVWVNGLTIHWRRSSTRRWTSAQHNNCPLQVSNGSVQRQSLRRKSQRNTGPLGDRIGWLKVVRWKRGSWDLQYCKRSARYGGWPLTMYCAT